MKVFSKMNKLFVTTLLTLGLLCTSFFGYGTLSFSKASVSAASYGAQTIEKITDDDFENFTGTTYGSPTNWSKVDGSDTANSDRFVSGIMNLTSASAWSSNYEDNFKIPENLNPILNDDSILDKNFLYINNFSTTPVKFGYSSESFSLDANSFYSITVRTKTTTSNGQNSKASLYLSGFDESYKMEDVTTSGAWQTNTFYIATNSIISNSNIKLELWLGSKTSGSYGVVYFSDVVVKMYDESTFNSISNKDSETSIYESLNEKVTNPFTNNGFESGLSGWSTSSQNSIDSENQLINSVKIGTGFNTNLTSNWNVPNPDTINTFNNNYALLIVNKTSLISGIESPYITVKQHGLYKLSVWAYTKSDTGNGATILVKEVAGASSTGAYNTLSVSTSTSGSTVNSGWKQYNVYIQGNSFKDTTVQLGLYLGSPEIGETSASPTTGYIYFDEIRIQEINNTEYEKGISDTDYSVELDITTTSSFGLVTNNTFNKTKNTDNSITYPLTPANYTSSVTDFNGDDVDNVTLYSGIVNVNSTHWTNNSSHYGEANNPGTFNNTSTDTSTNNVLMIGAVNPGINQVYTSDSFTLNASSYYKVSVWVQTQIYPQYDGGASIKLLNSTKYVYNQESINTHDEWQQITFYIKTGTNSLTSTFELGLKQTNGYAFFDELFIESYESEDIFNSVITSTSKVIDLTYEGFDTENSYNGYMDSSVTNQSAKDNLESGIHTFVNGNNALYINSNGSDVFYTFASTTTFSLTSGSYYKISVDVYTLGLGQEAENTNYDDDDAVLPYGATLSLKNSTSSFSQSITGIDTASVNDGDNKFTTYTFYINANESIEVYLYLSLGNLDALTCGTVYFDNIKLDSTLTEEQFEIAKNDYSLEKTSLIISEISTTDEEEETENEENTENEAFEFPWILISSLITSFAIILALIGSIIRKISFRAIPKIKTSYDRRKTLDIELDRKEKIALRQSMIEELKLQLHTIDDEIEAMKAMFEAKEAQILIQEKARRDQIEKEKLDVSIKREDATKEYKSILASAVSEKEKELAERHFARYIAKLNKNEEQLQKMLEQREVSYTALKIKREQQLQRYIDAQTAINKEIQKIEEEIEQIAKEDALVWEEYKRAKLDAKEQKIAYKQEKKLEKQTKKSDNNKEDK